MPESLIRRYIRKKIPRRRTERRGELEGRDPGEIDNIVNARVLARVIRFARPIRLSSHEGEYRAIMKHVILSFRRILARAPKIIAPTALRCRESDGSAPLRSAKIT